MLIYELTKDGLSVIGETEGTVKIERAGTDRLLKFPLYSFKGGQQSFIVRWNGMCPQGKFRDIFEKLAPMFYVVGASIDDDGTISASGICSCTAAEFLEKLREVV